jgi:hypothetical protein
MGESLNLDDPLPDLTEKSRDEMGVLDSGDSDDSGDEEDRENEDLEDEDREHDDDKLLAFEEMYG